MPRTRLLLALLVITLLAGYYFLAANYLRQRQQNQHLEAQIAGATLTLAQMPGPPADVDQRLAAARVSLSAMESALPERVNSTLAINTILRTADAVGVKAIPLITQPWSAVKNGGHTYYVLHLNVSVSGAFAQLTEFTNGLENGELDTLIIGNLSVDRENGPSTAGQGLEVLISASIDLAIYTRLPPAD